MSTPVASAPLALTVEETATLLRMGLRQTYDAARRGDIPAVKIGSRWYVKRPELERMFGLSPEPEVRAETAHGDTAVRPRRARMPESPRDSEPLGPGI